MSLPNAGQTSLESHKFVPTFERREVHSKFELKMIHPNIPNSSNWPPIILTGFCLGQRMYLPTIWLMSLKTGLGDLWVTSNAVCYHLYVYKVLKISSLKLCAHVLKVLKNIFLQIAFLVEHTWEQAFSEISDSQPNSVTCLSSFLLQHAFFVIVFINLFQLLCHFAFLRWL